jgi:hypothetical protein
MGRNSGAVENGGGCVGLEAQRRGAFFVGLGGVGERECVHQCPKKRT